MPVHFMWKWHIMFRRRMQYYFVFFCKRNIFFLTTILDSKQHWNANSSLNVLSSIPCDTGVSNEFMRITTLCTSHLAMKAPANRICAFWNTTFTLWKTAMETLLRRSSWVSVRRLSSVSCLPWCDLPSNSAQKYSGQVSAMLRGDLGDADRLTRIETGSEAVLKPGHRKKRGN